MKKHYRDMQDSVKKSIDCNAQDVIFKNLVIFGNVWNGFMLFLLLAKKYIFTTTSKKIYNKLWDLSEFFPQAPSPLPNRVGRGGGS